MGSVLILTEMGSVRCSVRLRLSMNRLVSLILTEMGSVRWSVRLRMSIVLTSLSR